MNFSDSHAITKYAGTCVNGKKRSPKINFREGGGYYSDFSGYYNCTGAESCTARPLRWKSEKKIARGAAIQGPRAITNMRGLNLTGEASFERFTP